MAEKKIWRVYCETESDYVASGWLSTKPTTCPNNAGHTINSGATTSIQSRPEVFSTPVVTFPIFSSTSDYKEITSESWEIVDDAMFMGTDYREPIELHLVASRAGASGTCYVRVWDNSNNQVIAEISWMAEDEDEYYDTTLTNLPASEAVWELQAKISSGGDYARVHSAAFY